MACLSWLIIIWPALKSTSSPAAKPFGVLVAALPEPFFLRDRFNRALQVQAQLGQLFFFQPDAAMGGSGVHGNSEGAAARFTEGLGLNLRQGTHGVFSAAFFHAPYDSVADSPVARVRPGAARVFRLSSNPPSLLPRLESGDHLDPYSPSFSPQRESGVYFDPYSPLLLPPRESGVYLDPYSLYSCRHGNLESIWIPTPRHSRRNGNPEPLSPSTLVGVCRNVPVGTSTCLHGAS